MLWYNWKPDPSGTLPNFDIEVMYRDFDIMIEALAWTPIMISVLVYPYIMIGLTRQTSSGTLRFMISYMIS